jgi:hypothetical protein
VSRILFVMLHPGFVRYYDGALEALAAAGHDVHVAFEISRTKLGEDVTAQRLATLSPRITCGEAPSRSESVRTFLSRSDRTATRSGGATRPGRRAWRDPETRTEAQESLATTVRLLVDYLRYFEPAFAGAPALRARAEKRLPRVYPPLIRWVSRMGSTARSTLRRLLLTVEEAIVPHASVETFVRERRPDLLLVTPLVELGSQQVDYVKCARRLGVRSALCVASWDNLTSKGLMRVAPDHVVVWNEAQKDEAVRLHGVRADQVAVTGAQLFDRWFAARPSRSREEFCARVGLDPARPFVLYTGSSMFIAPDEVPFVERWLAAVRSGDEGRPAPGVLVRPHPANVEQWRAFDATAHDNVAVWPPIGTTPNDPDFRRDFFDSLYYSAAVVGINTSAQIEAAIVGRPVLTIHSPEFAHAQEGTLHFQHLVGGSAGFVRESRSLPEHVAQLRAVVADPVEAVERDRRFVESFIRPHGIQVAAVPVFVEAIGSLAALPSRPPVPASWLARAARVPLSGAAWTAQVLAEDRPLWVYAMRPCLTAVVWIASVPFRAGVVWHEAGYPRVKRGARATHRAWYESRRTIAKLARRAKRPIVAVVRGAARRLAGRNA